MSETQAVALQTQPVELIPSMGTWNQIMTVCETLVQSGFLPKGINTPEKAAAVALKGNELGIPMMQSFSHIAIVQGKPTCSAELQLALVARGGVTWEFTENTDEKATVIFLRPGFSDFVSTFTMADAKRAGLVTRGSAWEKYPRAMLRARAISAGARVIGPDLIGGMSYTPEELGAVVDVETGEVIDTQAEVVDSKPAQEQNGQAQPAPEPEFDGQWYFNDETKEIAKQGTFRDKHSMENGLRDYILNVLFKIKDRTHKERLMAREVMEANLDLITAYLSGENLDAVTARFTKLKLHTVGEGESVA